MLVTGNGIIMKPIGLIQEQEEKAACLINLMMILIQNGKVILFVILLMIIIVLALQDFGIIIKIGILVYILSIHEVIGNIDIITINGMTLITEYVVMQLEMNIK